MNHGLFSHDDVIISTERLLGRNKFTISAADGTEIGHAEQKRLSLREMFFSSRSIELFDATASSPALTITDPVNFLRDTYEVTVPGNIRPLATVTNRLSFIRERFTIDMEGLPQVEVRGSVWRWNFELTSQERTVARIDTQWSGLGRFLLDKRTYALRMEPGLSPAQRAAVLGTTMCLEMARIKRRAAASS